MKDLLAIRQMVAQALDILPEQVAEISRIGGLTNKNYACVTPVGKVVVRCPGEGTECMIDRRVEMAHTLLAERQGWHPQVLYFGQDGLKISQYVAAAETLQASTVAEDTVLRKIAELLRELHQSNLVMQREIKYRNEFDLYLRGCGDIDTELYPLWPNLLAAMPAILKRLESLGIERCPCHNDLVPENFLLAKDRLYLLDWEYSAYNDPAWDLASFMGESRLSADARELFLNYYYEGNISSVAQEKIFIYEWLQHMLWFVWTLLKEKHGVFYGDYGRKRLYEAQRLLTELER